VEIKVKHGEAKLFVGCGRHIAISRLIKYKVVDIKVQIFTVEKQQKLKIDILSTCSLYLNFSLLF